MQHPYSLPRAERLRRRGAIRRLFEQGKSGFVFPLRYMWYRVAEPVCEIVSYVAEADSPKLAEPTEVMFSVPKRFHRRANKRNTLRRRVKESYRLQKSILAEANTNGAKIEMALIYSTKDIKSYKTIDNAVRKILENIAKEL